MKIWAKIKIKDKIIQDILFENNLKMSKNNFERTLRDMCAELDISTPVSLSVHYKHFDQFNIVKYLPRDFIDAENFECLEVENCTI